ncbi:putative quinol monooxygenase [Amycolatopsis umgeniensis]|uniref:Quinol monooxygenase YgiN n=1 Tax=Amycolatopsis umgeniensis TaxID=336628 RepID=A0A841BDC9_9PSEU|nr:antibiotic biosynthesis monooxygenase family protein [Amycolatopsis umgeniensis]MBB5857327.1 quinol monooxygenase YgiN [Amycolatopsis umgeniensis]
MTVIVAGKVYVDPEERDRYVEGHQVIVEKARAHPGCLDVVISADTLEGGRVNIFEYWESEEVLNAWRAVSPAPTYSAEIQGGEVFKHQVSRSGPPFD